MGENDSETLFRAMVAVGTLLHMGGEVKAVAVKEYLIRRAVDSAIQRVKETRIGDVGREIRELL